MDVIRNYSVADHVSYLSVDDDDDDDDDDG